MRKDGRTYDKNEPARQLEYRKLYLRQKREFDALEDQILYLKKRIDELCERVRVLEWNSK